MPEIWPFIKERLGLIVVVSFLFVTLWQWGQTRRSIAFSEALVEPVTGIPGEWTAITFDFTILRPECRMDNDTPLDFRIKSQNSVTIPINQYSPPDIRPMYVSNQRQSSYMIAFEVPGGMPIGPAEVYIRGVRVCEDPVLGGMITHRLVEGTPRYPINIVSGLDIERTERISDQVDE